jgi:hypothetical protein
LDHLDVYLSTLFDGLEGFVYSPAKIGGRFETYWFEWPLQREELKLHIRTLTKDNDVYVSPAVYREKRPKKDSIKRLQTVWAEFDGNEKIDFQNVALPSLLVQTSFETHVHCYWKIPPSNQNVVEDINRRLTYYLKADSSGWDATQILRPPDTVNHKHGLPVWLMSNNPGVHQLSSFAAIPAVSAPPTEVTVISDLLPVGEIIAAHNLPLQLVKMVRKETPVEPYRSSFLARLANELAEEDLTHLEIVSLLREADERIGKYSNRSDQLLRLSQIADYATHKHVAAETILVYTPDHILNYVESVQWIVPGWLHTTGQLILSSAPGVGKTQLALQLAYCLTLGQPFLNIEILARHRVLFMSLEMDKQSLKYILNHQRTNWDSMPNFHIIDETGSLTQYENLIAQYESTVVIVDSLTELFDDTADNPNAEARRVMRWCRKVRRRYGTAVVLIHHNRKATEGNKKPKGLSDLAGSFQLGKDSDTVLQLWEDHRGLELSGVKVRFGPKDEFFVERSKSLWFSRKGGKDDSNGTVTVRPDPPGDTGKFSRGFGH